jgi:hypothetical protein
MLWTIPCFTLIIFFNVTLEKQATYFIEEHSVCVPDKNLQFAGAPDIIPYAITRYSYDYGVILTDAVHHTPPSNSFTWHWSRDTMQEEAIELVY